MGNAVFPSLSGKGWGYVRKPQFNTKVRRSVSGREQRASFQQFPLYSFSLPFEFLRDLAVSPDAQTLIGFFMARQGSFDSFLYADPDDNSVTDMQFGTGDGVTKDFQLVRSYGAGGFTFAEPVQNLNGTPTIKDAGTPTSAFTVNSTGLISFTSAPATGHVLTWSGSFYYRCRFLADEIDPSKMMAGFWELKKLEFIGAPGNKV